jgi:hypothetical protein
VQPDIDVAGYVLQLSHANGKSRNAMRPGDARVLQGYVVGADAGAPMGTLLRYEDGAGAQQVLDLNSQPVGSGRLIGFMLEFQPGAKESFGQVTFTNGQVRMVVEDQRTGETIAVHPHAIISQADPANAEGLRRWPLDTQEVVIASVGGASTVNMGFEFAVPTGYTPKYLYIKNTRLDVSKTELAAYPTRTALTAAVIGGNLGSGSVKVADLERGDAVTTTASAGFGRSSGETGVSITNSIDFGFQTTQKGGLDLDEDNRVVSGTHEFFVKEVESSGNRIDAALRVDRFAVGDGRVMVQVEVSPDKPASMLGRVYRNATGVLPPQIIDNNGTPYQAIGYVYRDSEKIRVSIDPGAPIRGLSQLQSAGVAMSSSRADQRLVLLFLASEGVTITEYALGPKVVLTFDPPLDLSQGQR